MRRPGQLIADNYGFSTFDHVIRPELSLTKELLQQAVVWQIEDTSKEFQEQKVGLGLLKEIFDAEMWGISEAFKIAEHKTRGLLVYFVTHKLSSII